eukprot:scaffold791_cov92-Amphora_coffeaeformis.AAC.1
MDSVLVEKISKLCGTNIREDNLNSNGEDKYISDSDDDDETQGRSESEKEIHDYDEIHDLPATVEGCLILLSALVDRPAPAKPSKKTKTKGARTAATSAKHLFHMQTQQLAHKVATIPHFLQELLLIQDTAARNRVFSMSIVHK